MVVAETPPPLVLLLVLLVLLMPMPGSVVLFWKIPGLWLAL